MCHLALVDVGIPVSRCKLPEIPVYYTCVDIQVSLIVIERSLRYSLVCNHQRLVGIRDCRFKAYGIILETVLYDV